MTDQPTHLATKIKELEAAEENVRVAAKQHDDARAAAGRIRKEAQALMLAGATTGDPIKDYFLKSGGGINPEGYKRLRTINRMLKGKVGELVALLYTENVMVRSDQPREPRVRLLVGLLRGESLLFPEKEGSRPTIALPVSSYARKNYMGVMEIVQGPITVTYLHSYLEATNEKRLQKRSLQQYHGYVLSGTTAVRSLLSEWYLYGLDKDDFWGSRTNPEELFRDLGLLELDGN